MKLVLTPTEATEAALQALEDRGVIRRLLPARDRLPVMAGESRWTEVYAAEERFGSHKLIAVTINRVQPEGFSWHSAGEEFLLLPHGGAADLILTVSLLKAGELQRKAAVGTLSGEDFTALRFPSGASALGFFTMQPGYPHVETCTAETDRPPCFYVTESRNLDENPVDLGGFQVVLESV